MAVATPRLIGPHGGDRSGVHHHLGFEQPQRDGFGGLWSILDAPTATSAAEGATDEEPRHHVARSTGATAPGVAAAVAALLRHRTTLDAAA
jgi:hypothetical protein